MFAPARTACTRFRPPNAHLICDGLTEMSKLRSRGVTSVGLCHSATGRNADAGILSARIDDATNHARQTAIYVASQSAR